MIHLLDTLEAKWIRTSELSCYVNMHDGGEYGCAALGDIPSTAMCDMPSVNEVQFLPRPGHLAHGI